MAISTIWRCSNWIDNLYYSKLNHKFVGVDLFNQLNFKDMKNVFMSLAVVAAMFAAASCACNNNQKAEECTDCTECADCAGCDKAAQTCEASCDAACDKACDKACEGCEKACDKACEKNCDKHCEKACDKQCDKACEKECHKDKACKQCDSTCVDCKKAE